MLKYVGYDIVFQEIPDQVTLAINLSLCPNHCVGCHSPYLRNDVGNVLDEKALDEMLAQYVGEVARNIRQGALPRQFCHRLVLGQGRLS